MPIPGFQKLMLPLLQILGDSEDHTRAEVVDKLAQQFQLSDEERREVITSGAARFDNRVDWARSYLKMAGLLVNTGRGTFRITEAGCNTLREAPGDIDKRYLMRFPEFMRAVGSTQHAGQSEDRGQEAGISPAEELDNIYQSLRRALAQELLEKAKSCSPAFFERLVVDLLVAMGYGGSRADAGEAIGGTGDGGVDGLIKEDKLGLDVVFVQAKRWQNTVGRPDVQSFAGSLEGQRARRGVFITTSHFSPDARDYVDRIDKKIILVDGEHLAELMIDHGVGVTDVQTYSVKKIDLDYFEEE